MLVYFSNKNGGSWFNSEYKYIVNHSQELKFFQSEKQQTKNSLLQWNGKKPCSCIKNLNLEKPAPIRCQKTFYTHCHNNS